MDVNIKGKVALITGSGSGIGLATAKLFGREGARVGLLVREEERGREVQEKIRAVGGESMVLVGDITKPEQMNKAAAQLAEKYGQIDVVFANAGINGVWAPLDKLEVDEFRKTVEVNFTGTYITIKAAYPYMREHGGSIIVTSSVNGTRMFSNTGATAYAATKAAQAAMAQMLAVELASDRIRVNVVCPGAISTSIDERTERRELEAARLPVKFPEGKIPLTGDQPGKPEQVADAVLYLASPAASHVTGTLLYVDGAQSLLQG